MIQLLGAMAGLAAFFALLAFALGPLCWFVFAAPYNARFNWRWPLWTLASLGAWAGLYLAS